MTHYIINSLIFSAIGIVVLLVGFLLIEILTPRHNVLKEIFEKQNIAASILMGCFVLALAIIIASAIHG